MRIGALARAGAVNAVTPHARPFDVLATQVVARSVAPIVVGAKPQPDGISRRPEGAPRCPSNSSEVRGRRLRRMEWNMRFECEAHMTP